MRSIGQRPEKVFSFNPQCSEFLIIWLTAKLVDGARTQLGCRIGCLERMLWSYILKIGARVGERNMNRSP